MRTGDVREFADTVVARVNGTEQTIRAIRIVQTVDAGIVHFAT